jgi:hypothetical protein
MSGERRQDESTGRNSTVRGWPLGIYFWLELIRTSLNEMADNAEDDEEQGD